MDKDFDVSQARAYAAQCALWIGALWTASFLCSINSLGHTLLGLASNVLAVLSVVLLVMQLRRFAATCRFTFGRRWWMAWNTCMYAALLTTFCQYIYFRYIDGGRFLSSLTALVEEEQYREMWKRVQPDINPNDMISSLADVSLGSTITSLLMFNFILAAVCSLLSALLAGSSKTAGDNKDNA